MSVLPGFLGEVERYVGEYGYLAVSLGILLEDFGLPTPGETLLIVGAIAASRGTLDIASLLLLAWAGAVVGDNIGYAIGRTGGHRLMVRFGKHFGVTDARLAYVEKMFDRYGGAVVLLGRFVLILRQFNGIVAGTLEMPWWHFLWLNAVGAALWVAFWGLLAFWLGKRVLDLVDTLHMATPMLAGLGIVVTLAALGFWWWRHRRSGRHLP